MEKQDTKMIELLMDGMNEGIVFVDEEHKIRLCNRKAKEYTGIIINPHASHEGGQIKEGDIVIIADNMLGEDDGKLRVEELATINIEDKDIHQGDMLVAVGVYKNKKIEPQYKYMRGGQVNMDLKLDVNYFGFHIEASIDTGKRRTRITVNGASYPLKYYHSVGNMVIIDGTNGDIKFFQAKGYSVRNEDLGNLLRGESFIGKSREDRDIDINGLDFLALFDESRLSNKLFDILRGRAEPVRNRLYQINKRPFICNLLPWQYDENGERNPENKIHGVFLIIQEAEHLETLLHDRNEILHQLEESEIAEPSSNADFPMDAFEGFVGKSSAAREVKYMAYKASKNNVNVILTGESGTGKSMLAREIHEAANPQAPFVEVNCNAIAPSLFESELFGYVGGAFTGARNDGKIGFFEAANKGTIFLDEIGEIPLDIQVKLLHVLQNKTIYRVGSSKPIKVDVRVIAATNKNLEEEVAQGRFRQDLFYRINVFPIEIPPIRERKPDLYLLINQILEKACRNYGMEQKQFSGEALQRLTSYNWPGNVRELENAIERAITLCDSNIIYSEYLRIGKGDIPVTMREILAKEEARVLEMTMMKYNGDKQKAMEELDMSRTVFYDKLKKYNIKY